MMMLKGSLEQAEQVLQNETVKKRMIYEFINQYFSGVNQSGRDKILDQYKEYLDTKELIKLKNIPIITNI